MTTTRAMIIKNAGALMGSQLATTAVTLLLMIFLPRYLGPSVLGEWQIAASIWATLSVLITFGTDTLLIKQIARAPQKAEELLGTVLVLRGCLFVVSCALIALFLSWQSYSATTVHLVWITGVAHLIGQLTSAGMSALQGLEIMHYESISTVVGRTLNTALLLTLMFLGYGVYVIACAGILVALVPMLMQLHFLGRYGRVRLRPHLRQSWPILRSSAPYLLAGMTLVVYSQMDMLMLASLVEPAVVAWYGLALQLCGTLLCVPLIFTTALFPALARGYAHDPAASGQIIHKSFDLMLLVGVPIGLGLLVISEPLVVLLFGQAFAPVGPVLAVMGVVLVFMGQNILLGRFMVSIDRQNTWTLLMVAAMLLTFPLDLWLVPWCQRTLGNGAVGGALSYVVTESGMMAVGIVLLPRGTLRRANIATAARILVAGLAMLAVCWPLRHLFLAVPVIVGAAVYLGMILLLRVAPAEDLALAKALARRLIGRLRRRAVVPSGVEGV